MRPFKITNISVRSTRLPTFTRVGYTFERGKATDVDPATLTPAQVEYLLKSETRDLTIVVTRSTTELEDEAPAAPAMSDDELLATMRAAEAQLDGMDPTRRKALLAKLRPARAPANMEKNAPSGPPPAADDDPPPVATTTGAGLHDAPGSPADEFKHSPPPGAPGHKGVAGGKHGK